MGHSLSILDADSRSGQQFLELHGVVSTSFFRHLASVCGADVRGEKTSHNMGGARADRAPSVLQPPILSYKPLGSGRTLSLARSYTWQASSAPAPTFLRGIITACRSLMTVLTSDIRAMAASYCDLMRHLCHEERRGPGKGPRGGRKQGGAP
eukprot:scaffold11352_cov114-Isochrysis_galbana.AAC.7